MSSWIIGLLWNMFPMHRRHNTITVVNDVVIETIDRKDTREVFIDTYTTKNHDNDILGEHHVVLPTHTFLSSKPSYADVVRRGLSDVTNTCNTKSSSIKNGKANEKY